MASARGGLVFIDEAYNLGGSRGRGASLYAQEAVDQLTYCMTEDSHKGRTIVVLAGYEREMNDMLASANPGFRSRFKQRIAMPDWDAADVVEYLRRRCNKKGIVLADAAQRVLLGGLDDVRKRPGWANARDAEWLFDELTGTRLHGMAFECLRVPSSVADGLPLDRLSRDGPHHQVSVLCVAHRREMMRNVRRSRSRTPSRLCSHSISSARPPTTATSARSHPTLSSAPSRTRSERL